MNDTGIAVTAGAPARPARFGAYRSQLRHRAGQVVVAGADALSFGAIAFLLGPNPESPRFTITPAAFGWHLNLYYAIAAIFIVARFLAGDYSRRQLFWDEARGTTRGILLASVPFILIDLSRGTGLGRELLTWAALVIAVPTMRQLGRFALSRVGLWRLPTALIASGGRSSLIYDALSSTLSLGYDIRWVVTSKRDDATPEGLPKQKTIISDNLEEVATQLAAGGCEQVVVATDDLHSFDHAALVQHLLEDDIPIVIIPTVPRLPMADLSPSFFFGRDILMLQVRSNLRSFSRRVLKRAFDIAGAITALIFFSPIFLVIAAAIKIKYPTSPVFFGSRAVGRYGHQFRMWKFSTMVPDAHLILEDLLSKDAALRKEWEDTFKLKDDPRIMPGFGAFLRRTSLNELPQFFNVLVGDMSLVGPRPVVKRELDKYYGRTASLYVRVRPGVTGLWQVSGRSDTSYEERVMYDEWYILNWSFWYDIVIMLQTVWTVALRKGAY